MIAKHFFLLRHLPDLTELGPGREHCWEKEKQAKLSVVVWGYSQLRNLRDLKHITS